MKRGVKNITKDLIKRKLYLKHELKVVFLKSIIQNKNCKPIVRSYAYYKLMGYSRKTAISSQNNVCLMRGRHKGVWKFTQLSRHALNKFGLTGHLQNIKIKGW